MRKEHKGNYSNKLPVFDDSAQVGKSAKISQLKFWYDSDHIYGVQAFYSIDRGTDVAGKEHLDVANKTALDRHSIEIDSDDRIATISGSYKDCIGYLKICTAKGYNYEIGSEDGKNAQTAFLFDISDDEYPSIVYGSLEKGGTRHITL